MADDGLSLAQARRVALAAQGFDRPRPARVATGHLRAVLRRLSLLQMDFVSVLTPAHYQVPFSRLGPYPPALLDELVYAGREFTEQWAHEASIVPADAWALLRHRRETHRVRPYGFEAALERHAEYVRWVLEQVRRRGPLTAADLPTPEGVSRRIEGAWVSFPRGVLEAYFGRGVLAVVGRRPDGARLYDLAERVLPPEHHGRHVDRDEAERELLRRAAAAHGIGTAADLADYYRMPVRQALPRLAEMAAAGELTLVRVEGWREPAYLHPQARLPRRIDAAALLSPFDPVVWFRPRTARLFGFEYRFEIFVPAPKRRWGCYVLPFLLGDRLVARVDLKAERDAGRLLVAAAYLEDHADAGAVAGPLAAELRTLAAWLGLDAVAVGRRGNLIRPLVAALRG
jgi:uncharacterized protein YcaQ